MERYGADMSLADAKVGEEYFVKDIIAEDEELRSFLFSLGCYSGEPITGFPTSEVVVWFL